MNYGPRDLNDMLVTPDTALPARSFTGLKLDKYSQLHLHAFQNTTLVRSWNSRILISAYSKVCVLEALEALEAA